MTSIYAGRFFSLKSKIIMPNKVDIRKHKILSMLAQERSLLAYLVAQGEIPSNIHERLRENYPNVNFSLEGFMYAFKRLEPELYEQALRNRKKSHLSIQAYENQIRELVNSGHSLKQIQARICPHITYSLFIMRLREHAPDLHFRGKQNGLKRKYSKPVHLLVSGSPEPY